MPLVQCQHINCIYCDVNNDFECKAPAITIGDDWDVQCSAYENYQDTDEYRNEFFIAVETKNGESARVKVYCGKRIEYKGRMFYTYGRTDNPDSCFLTDAETGRGVGSYSLLLERFDRICEQAAKHPKVETLPEAEWTSGGYELAKEDHHDKTV